MGWEPYPTSMRALHWLGWLHRHGGTLQAFERERILGSLAAQLEHLSEHVETHLDGNHLWTNLVALSCGGVALRGPLPQRLLERFAPRLVETVRDQLLGDGTHGERTPSYHCLLAEQLAVLLPFARAQRPRLAEALAPALSAMLSALPAFTHPDGDVALWGDSQRDAPVTPARLLQRLGRALPQGHADDAFLKYATDELVAERMQIMQIMNGHVMATMQVPNLVDRLHELQCPVLGFWGMNEKMMPENGIMAMAKNIAHLRLILVTECGHWVMVEHEAMFNRACLDFLQHG